MESGSVHLGLYLAMRARRSVGVLALTRARALSAAWRCTKRILRSMS